MSGKLVCLICYKVRRVLSSTPIFASQGIVPYTFIRNKGDFVPLACEDEEILDCVLL